MTFDPMAAAVDWLDAYRAGDIDAILKMYADDAVTDCSCDGVTIIGKASLRAYWEQRLKDYPASDLVDLQPSDGGTTIFYIASAGVVDAALQFDAGGRITSVRCGPLK